MAKTSTKQPSAAQLDALHVFAVEQGPEWRTALLDAWARGYGHYGYEYGPRDARLTAYLQQVRNQFGPSWLRTFAPDADRAVAALASYAKEPIEGEGRG